LYNTKIVLYAERNIKKVEHTIPLRSLGASAEPGGETHYTVRIISAAFEGLSRVDRQRPVNAALKHEFETGLDALALSAMTPGEAPQLVGRT
jgi:stress-induced morphogen